MKINIPTLIVTLSLTMLTSMAGSAREVISLNADWGFSRKAVTGRGVFTDKSSKPDTVVSLPHTWNAQDFLDDAGYYRGPGSYLKDLDIPSSYAGKRLFLKFDGAGTVANVFVNQVHVGEHRGAYNAFTFEITPYVKPGETNKLVVVCDNSLRFDVAPQGGDFNVYGGLYRDAWLIVTDDACISPLYYGSNGLIIRQQLLTPDRAELRAEVHLSSLTGYEGCELELSLLDDKGQAVSRQTASCIVRDKAIVSLHIDQPHLWNGVADPYLYQAVAVLRRNGVELDRVDDHVGLRTFYLDADRGFFLNGSHLKLHGVSRHQDWAGVASALTEEHHRCDNEYFSEMGVNAIRLAHYPQAKFMFQEADRRGFVVWEEIPLVGAYVESVEFDDHLKLQLTEMILQNYNHPSICFWGLFNEIDYAFDPIVSELNDLAHSLDPVRLTVCANYREGSFNHITDGVAWNRYYGWYYGHAADFGTFFDEYHAQHPSAKIAVSEYGSGASIQHHVAKYEEGDNPKKESSSRFHPEERQTLLHMLHIPLIEERDYLWGTYVWNMFDFASAHRTEGDSNNINDKGLITYDRKYRKDAFFLYKANWNKQEKTVHICSKRYTERQENTTDVIVFTTAPSARLYINGKQVASGRPDAYATIVWPDVQLSTGVNKVEVRTAHGADSCEWIVK